MLRQQAFRVSLLSTFAVLLLLLTTASVAIAGPALLSSAAIQGSSEVDQYCSPASPYERTKFRNSTKIDNSWSPLVPGTEFVYQGFANTGGQPLPHQVVLIVTGLTKEVNAVRTRVLWDRD